MLKISSPEKRIQSFLLKQSKKPAWDFADAPDVRKEELVSHEMGSILWALELGLMSNQPTLRDVEAMTHKLAAWGRRLVPEGISDTTLDTESRRLNEEYLLTKLVAQVRDCHRSRMLGPFGLPMGVVTIDGKNLATLDHDAGGSGHERTEENKKWDKRTGAEQKRGGAYYLMPALRATLVSSEAKPCILQQRLRPGTGESSAWAEFVDALHGSYGRSGMMEVIDGDAGLCSLENADHVDQLGYGYVFGLKGNQPELHAEAERLLILKAAEEPPEAESPWECRNGKKIRRRLWRTDEMRGFINSVGTWSHLRQTWLVKQETLDAEGKTEVEDRLFITSLLWNRLTGHEILTLVRNHWGVENDAFNSLDTQWKEDHGPWCTQGEAIWVLGVLRLMAYNMVQYLRKRRLRRKEGRCREEPMSWRQLFLATTIVLAVNLSGTDTPIG